MTAALVLEADVLWRELTALHAHSAVHQVATAASVAAPPAATSPVHPVTSTHGFASTHGAVHTQAVTHSTAVTSAPVHTALPVHAARPVVDMSQVTGAHSAAPVPQRIDLSAHSSGAPSTHAASTTTTTASTGHTGVAVGTASVKGGLSGLALACTIGAMAVLGVGAAVYANDQPNSSQAAASSSVSPPDLSGGTLPTDDTSPTVDPVCATLISDLPPEIQQFSTDAAVASDAVDSYNSDMEAYNSGETSTAPDDSTFLSEISTVISDLDSVESTLQGAISQAQDSSVASDLDDMLTATQQIQSLYRSYEDDPTNSGFDTSSQGGPAMLSAADSLDTDCGE
jgi:hypothetical protein